jgi:H/ACA ribonucleoprotein complex subunit 4
MKKPIATKNITSIAKQNIKKWITISEEASLTTFGVAPGKREIREYIRNGLILLDKPSGPTSHQVDRLVKDLFREYGITIKKNSHGGTLDPRTSGVLVIAIENSTKLMPILLKSNKEYVALMNLHSDVPRQEIIKACNDFVGKIKQLPPVKSAVLRAVREREIYSLKILEIRGRDVLMRVGCEAGTYIRRLHDDIGKRLNTGAHMQELRRSKSGIFTEKKLVTLQNLADALAELKKGNEKPIRGIVLPMEIIGDNIRSVVIKDSAVGAICNGAPLAVQGCVKVEEGIVKGEWVGAFTLKGELVSIGKAVKDYSKGFKRGMFVKTDRVLMKKGTYPNKWGKK